MRKSTITLIAVLLISACKQKKINIPTDTGLPFKDYISAYTAGVISKTNRVHFVLKDSIPNHLLSDQNAIKSFLDVTPSFKYDINVTNARNIAIIPKEYLATGTRYQVTVDMEELLEKKLDTKEFKMVFETLEQDFTVNDLNLEPQNINSPDLLKLKGTLTTDDVATLDQVSTLITKIGDLNISKIKWSKQGYRTFIFELENITKKAKPYTLSLQVDGKSIGQERTYKTLITVPAIEDFKLNTWQYVTSPDKVLTLTFTENLDNKQNLKGFIQLENIKDYKYTISGNTVKLFLNNSFTGTTKLKLYPGIKNNRGKKSQKQEEFEVIIDEPLPSIEMIGKGTILPNSQGLIIPFKTIGLKKIDIDVYRIHEKNILQFLQVNNISERSQLRRVAEKIKTKTINLQKKNGKKLKQWTTHGLNLKDIINIEPGAIYRVRFSFSQSYTFCECEEENSASYNSEYYDYYENDRYNNRKDYNTCESYYYYHSTRSKNLLASDLGVIVKKGTLNNYTIISTNLVEGKAQPNTKVRFYNYQQRLLKTITTNENGIANLKFEENPHVLIAQSGKHKAYVKLQNGRTNSLSKFDTEGVTRTDGVDAFFYGERGVWRPGDEIHLSFIIRDEFKTLKDGLPMKLVLVNPKGQIVSTKKMKLTTKGIHSVKLKTETNDPTGNYSVKVTAGSHTFYKSLKIETIRPNRLKIKIEPEHKEIQGANVEKIDISSAWLHGAIAGNLKTNIKMVLSPTYTSFPRFKSYGFEDITKHFNRTEHTIFNDTLNSDGECTIKLHSLHVKSKGKLKASLVTKVFEKGGGFSIDQLNTIYHPYNTYVGMRLPLNNYGSLPTVSNNKLSFVCVNTKGDLNQKKDTLSIKIYKLEWRWWWRHNNNDIARYVNNNSYNLIEDKKLITENGRANYNFKVSEYNWGQYFIQVTHNNGHSTSRTIYVDYPGNERRERKQDNAMLLSMKADKNKYEPGQKAKISFPSASAGRALVSIENDIETVKTFWVNTTKGTSNFTLNIDKSMAPNCYVHVTALQKHQQDDNDLPLRMYGVIPITVFNKSSILNPIITLKEEIRPEVLNTITIKEKNGRGMHYTLAIVDEGLLDLTRFRTPKVWNHFNKKRALGVSTWDVYDDVIKSFSGKFDNVYRIGGDGAGKGGNTAKANRFKPVVKFLGPFYLKPGERASHKIKISNYIGSVRAMVVCRSGSAFGKADATAKVKKPLMIQANAPRVFTPQDELNIPITVFASEKVKFPIHLKVKSDNYLTIQNPNITINKVTRGEKVVFVKVKVNNKLGVAKLHFTATCANDKHSEKMEVQVRMPGYEIDAVQDTFLPKGQSATLTYEQLGWEGTNKAMLEVSQYPSINLDKRLRYLIQYPHGCIEQTTSSVFPQLYLSDLTDLPTAKEKRIEKNIQEGIKRIKKFMTVSGGFSYWPGGYQPSEWGTNYAGHFLLEAKAKGYYVPDHLLNKWYTYQTEKANEYKNSTAKYHYRYQDELIQSYRLYTLALYGKPDIGAMNRLKESNLKSNTAKWRLASTYALSGQVKAAADLVTGISYEVKTYRDDYYSYGSNYRDEAIILESMSYMQNHSEIQKSMKRVAENLGANRWMSTQETAYSLCAFGKVVSTAKKGKAQYSIRENQLSAKQILFGDVISQTSMVQVNKNNTLTIRNTGDNPIYIRLINTGTPQTTEIESGANALSMKTTYTDAKGNLVDNDSFSFGEDYKVTIFIKNLNNKDQVNNIALSTFFPAGFEIQNSRMFKTSETSQADYEDVRDDKVHTYFALRPSQSRTFTYTITASFKGKYLHPGVNCEAMYDASIFAREKGYLINIH